MGIKAIDPLEEEIKAFVQSVSHRTPPPVTGKDGRDALELALQINEAIGRSRKLVPAFAGAGLAGEGQNSP